MSAAAELQRLVVATLAADVAVSALVAGRIYDRVPPEPAFPYLSLGPSQEIESDEECIRAETHYLQVDAWSRSADARVQVKRLNAAVKAALHEAGLALADPYALVSLRVEGSRSMWDRDGKTGHGLVSLRALVEI